MLCANNVQFTKKDKLTCKACSIKTGGSGSGKSTEFACHVNHSFVYDMQRLAAVRQLLNA